MTVPHDEQPLTRRQLRDLERQKPRKQQKEEAKAAEEAEAKRRADEAARAAEERASFEVAAARAVVAPAAAEPVESEPVESAPVEPAPADSAPAASETAGSAFAISESAISESAASAPPVSEPAMSEPVATSPAIQPAESSAPADVVAPAPILSRRARRALSADHPLAEQQPAAAPTAPEVADASHAEATGPIIAEIVHDDEPVEDDVVTVESEHIDAATAGSAADSASEPMVEELMVVDDYVSPEVQAEEAEELAEIDDTPEPEPVHIVTIDETPSAPILAPMFQAAAAPERPANTVDLSKASFDELIASRGVGASNSVASTSALVLPSVPNHGDVGTALDETGEVIITGSIDLPMSLGSTGAAPADGLESSELDAFLDPESEVGSDVAPVSATRAISTHGPSSGLVAPPKRRGANAPVILAVTAGVLAVGVVGLLLAAFVFRIF